MVHHIWNHSYLVHNFACHLDLLCSGKPLTKCECVVTFLIAELLHGMDDKHNSAIVKLIYFLGTKYKLILGFFDRKTKIYLLCVTTSVAQAAAITITS